MDVGLEDGEERGPLSGLFPAGLPVKTLEASLAGVAATYPRLGPTGVLYKKALRKARQIADRFPGMSVDQLAAIVLYTMEAARARPVNRCEPL